MLQNFFLLNVRLMILYLMILTIYYQFVSTGENVSILELYFQLH